ncbi:MAG: hypothetical protein QY318_00655 [Candidatus Dojkabacteria bacterium]|nr:MAG: hypothetical protein QY318_00655 [Candidatus Dojkabacteria bacterium]
MAFQFLKNIFSSNSANVMTFYQLYQKMRAWNKSGTFPYEFELPDVISFPEDFWKKVIELYKLTKSDGNERAISVFWADGELVLSSVVRGDSRSVKPNNKIRVSYVQSKHQGYLTKEVYVDEKKYMSKDVYHKRAPKEIEIKYLFNMHTHPPHNMQDGSTFYSFFSLQDLRSLLGSNAVITGMIGDKLWLLFRTVKTPQLPADFEEREISVETLGSRLELGVYSGDFNGKLYRHKPAGMADSQQ